MQDLEKTINCAVSSYKEGLERKTDTIGLIVNYVRENFIPKEQIERLPVSAIEMLSAHGVEAVVSKGRLESFTVARRV